MEDRKDNSNDKRVLVDLSKYSEHTIIMQNKDNKWYAFYDGISSEIKGEKAE